jgi:hypothetical protein
MPPASAPQPLATTENGALASASCCTCSDHVVSTQSTSPSMPLTASFVHAPPGRSPS